MGVPSAMDRRSPNAGSPIDPAFLRQYTRGGAKPRVRLENDGTMTLLNVGPETFMPPEQPVFAWYQDPAYGALRRRFDYQVGINQFYTPRANSRVSFEQLRALARNCNVLRVVIQKRKDQMAALDWKLDYKDEKKGRDDAIEKLETLLQYPDRRKPYITWLAECLEEVFVTDALSVCPVFLGDGSFYALEQINGATVHPLIDADGRAPLPPEPAYQQILKGIVAADYTSEELLYWPRNPIIDQLYGFPPVEWIITTVNIALRREQFQLEYYRQGSIPDAMVGVPDNWTPEQIQSMQTFWDALFMDPNAEAIGERRKLKFMPGGGKVTFAKDAILKDEFDEWLARLVCAAFNEDPTPYIKQVNRATAETQKEASSEQGLIPLKKWWKSFMDFIIATVLKRPDVHFVWDEAEEVDRKTASDIACQEVDRGIVTVNEVRAERGQAPLPGGDGEREQTTEQPAGAQQDGSAQPSSSKKPEGDQKPDGAQQDKGSAAGSTTVHVHVGKAMQGLMGKRIDATKRVPYGFGISEDGTTIFRDYRIPPEITVEGVVIPLDVTCGAHEVAEFQRIRAGAPYLGEGSAHDFATNEAEHPLVRSFNVEPEAYEGVLAPFVDGALVVTDVPTPPDLATYPYAAMEQTHLLTAAPAQKLAKREPRAAALDVQRQRLERAVKRQLRAQATAVKTALRSGGDARAALDDAMKSFPAAVADPLKRAAAYAVHRGAGALSKLQKDDTALGVGIGDEFVNTYAEQYALDRGAEMVGMKWVQGELVPNPDARWQITDETRAGLADLLEQQTAQGWTVDELAEKIDAAYAFSPGRAEVIARTETRLADSMGQLASWKESGVVARKVWLTSNDGCCDVCKENAAAGEIDIDDEFPSGDESTPGHPNCKCTIAPVVGDDEEGSGE